MRNVDERQRFIEKFGKQKFLEVCEKDPHFEELKEVPCPPEYEWIFRHFMSIWQNCEYDISGNIIFTYRTVNEYVECMKAPLTVEDKKQLFKMKSWAMEAISELKEKDD